VFLEAATTMTELRNQGGKTARERRKAKPAAKASPLPICTCQGNADDAPEQPVHAVSSA
jgi:hypothetical protein